VRDLVPKEGAVDTENNFAMKYAIIEKNEKHIAAIEKALKKADALLLATDPDREGEAISWHLYEILKERGELDGKAVKRVVFYEITKRAVQDAVDNPRELSTDLVSAQQARRGLDYLFGFNLSPLLWKKIKPGLSAGRVQTPALRLIVERELEIEAFIKQEYWTIQADVGDDPATFAARLAEYQGEKVEQFSFVNEKDATAVRDTLLDAAAGKLRVNSIEKKQRKRNPTAPFTTSTLQQEAARKLGFTTQRTMRTAQQLYEGIDTGEGAVGLITYMRTDSVNLAEEALTELQREIEAAYSNILVGLGVTPILEERAPRFIYVVGEVDTPGRFTLEGPTTAMQAVALAGSWNVGANLRQVIIFRRDDQWNLMATRLNLQGALRGNDPCPAGEVWLRDSDIVLVPPRQIKLIDDAIELVFTRGIYSVLPIIFTDSLRPILVL